MLLDLLWTANTTSRLAGIAVCILGCTGTPSLGPDSGLAPLGTDAGAPFEDAAHPGPSEPRVFDRHAELPEQGELRTFDVPQGSCAVSRAIGLGEQRPGLSFSVQVHDGALYAADFARVGSRELRWVALSGAWTPWMEVSISVNELSPAQPAHEWTGGDSLIRWMPTPTPDAAARVLVLSFAADQTRRGWSVTADGIGEPHAVGLRSRFELEPFSTSLDARRVLLTSVVRRAAERSIVMSAVLIDESGSSVGQSHTLPNVPNELYPSFCAVPTQRSGAFAIHDSERGQLHVLELNAQGEVAQQVVLPGGECAHLQGATAGLLAIARSNDGYRIHAIVDGDATPLTKPIAAFEPGAFLPWMARTGESALLVLVHGPESMYVVRVSADGASSRVSGELPTTTVIPSAPGSLYLHALGDTAENGLNRVAVLEVTCNAL